jgi:spore coat protein U-like protein
MQSSARAWRGYGTALAACFLIPWAGAAYAASTTTTFAVQATITATCTINSASTLNFGTVGVLAGNTDQTSTIQVTCTNTTPYNIGLDVGTGSGATVAVRKLTSGGATVNYSLYTDAGRATLWGNTVGTDTQAGTGNGAAQNYTVYGRIPAQTTPAPGNYADTITVTVTY